MSKVVVSLDIMYQSIPSLTTLPPATLRDSHILVAPGVGFSLLRLARGSAWGSSQGALIESKSWIILRKKNAIYPLSLKQMGSSSFYMFIYAKSEQCDLGPIYTITNTQHIRIYPGKLKFILVKFHRIQDVYMANMPKKTKLYSHLLLLRILYPDSPVHTSANTERILDFRFVQLCCKFTRVNPFTP